MGIERQHVEVEGLRLHYRTGGDGPPVLLLHGWPTSSALWRDCLPALSETNRVLALDLPGFGDSDKPLDVSYSFRFFDRMLSGFLDAVDAPRVGLAVHDLGGPVGLHWMVETHRVDRLALLNTLVYPNPSWAVMAFIAATHVSGVRRLLTSQWGLATSLRFGLGDRANATPEGIEHVQRPFRTSEARQALLKAGQGLHPGGFSTIAERLPAFEGPVRILYGERDRILPDVAQTMARVKADLPQAEVTSFPEAGHFLQEEVGPEIGVALSEFFAA